MITSTSRSNLSPRVLYISADSGKGKSTLVDYLIERCRENNSLPLFIDFSAFHITSELEFIDTAIEQFLYEAHLSDAFQNYRHAIEQLALTKQSDTIIEHVQIINTKIGTILFQNSSDNPNSKLMYLESRFFQDLNNAVQRLGGKVVFFLDAYERAGKEIQDWIDNKLLLSNNLGPHILFVIASQNDITLSSRAKQQYRIAKYRLPETYDYEAWIEYGRQRNIRNVKVIETCYKCWKGEPFRMCITLEPFAEQEE